MKFFSRKAKQNDDCLVVDNSTEAIQKPKTVPSHAMTVDEILNSLNSKNDNTPHTHTDALNSLKKRMNVSPAETPKTEKVDLSPKQVAQPSKVLETKQQEIATTENDALDVHSKATLMEKVKRYTIDEQGQDMSESREPLYKLESVADIIMSDGQTAMRNLSEKYGIDLNFDYPRKVSKTNQVVEKAEANTISKSGATKQTIEFEKMVNYSEKRESKERLEALFPNNNKQQPEKTNDTVPHISDIDTREIGTPSSGNTISSTATIRFTPVKDSLGNTDHISVSSATKHIDLGNDFSETTSPQSASQSLEKSEFEKFSPKMEATDIASGKKLLHKLALQKRSNFLIAIVSALCVVALSVFLIPPVYDFIIANPKNAMFTCGAFLLVSIIANIKMFGDFKNLINKKCGFDIFAAVYSTFSLLLAIVAAYTTSNAYYMLLLCSIVLFVRALCAFKETSYVAGNLRLILNEKQKNAITLINDPATTFAMAKDKIDGDVLAASHRNTTFVSNYMKHNEYSQKLSGKIPFLFYFTLAFSILCAVIAFFYYQSAFYAFYSATVIMCMASAPTLFFIDCLPLSAAAKRLNTYGAMIAGMYGAEKIELTNAAHVHICDVFPAGSVKMYSMRVLSKNNIDDTFLRAASLTAAVNSPLEAIFNQIAGTNSSYTIPDSDTVKYEKNLGISGWVNNELLFIGNRSFMQAHGIQIPSLEVDKKILRKGYFPVYVATTDTACALIVIQYEANPYVAKQLRKITDLGVTLLIENSDPNITEEMICDYFGLYNDSVKIMSTAGVHMLKNATSDCPECSAPAAYSGSHLNTIRIINCASMIKRSNTLLTIMYVLFSILGIMGFVYAAFSGLISMPQQTSILLYALGTTLLSIIGFLIRKP